MLHPDSVQAQQQQAQQDAHLPALDSAACAHMPPRPKTGAAVATLFTLRAVRQPGSVAECPVCGELVPVDELQQHVDAELEALEAAEAEALCRAECYAKGTSPQQQQEQQEQQQQQRHELPLQQQSGKHQHGTWRSMPICSRRLPASVQQQAAWQPIQALRAPHNALRSQPAQHPPQQPESSSISHSRKQQSSAPLPSSLDAVCQQHVPQHVNLPAHSQQERQQWHLPQQSHQQPRHLQQQQQQQQQSVRRRPKAARKPATRSNHLLGLARASGCVDAEVTTFPCAQGSFNHFDDGRGWMVGGYNCMQSLSV